MMPATPRNETEPVCPRCGSDRVVKNGRIHNGKQNHRCRRCDRQFVQAPQHRPIDEPTRALIDRLLLERLSLAGICRAVGVSASWLQAYVNAKYDRTPRRAEPPPQKRS